MLTADAGARAVGDRASPRRRPDGRRPGTRRRHRLRAECEPPSSRIRTDSNWDPDRLQAASGPTPSRIRADSKRDSDRLQAASGPTPSRIRTDSKRDSDRLQAASGPIPSGIRTDFERVPICSFDPTPGVEVRIKSEGAYQASPPSGRRRRHAVQQVTQATRRLRRDGLGPAGARNDDRLGIQGGEELLEQSSTCTELGVLSICRVSTSRPCAARPGHRIPTAVPAPPRAASSGPEPVPRRMGPASRPQLRLLMRVTSPARPSP